MGYIYVKRMTMDKKDIITPNDKPSEENKKPIVKKKNDIIERKDDRIFTEDGKELLN
jgi:hypothetical protein